MASCSNIVRRSDSLWYPEGSMLSRYQQTPNPMETPRNPEGAPKHRHRVLRSVATWR
jgi:hypothetical protein